MDRASPNVTAENFLERVLRRSVSEPVLLVFWAPWNSKSARLVDAIEDDAPVELANVDTSKRLGDQFAGRTLPRALLFTGGCPVDVVSGASLEDLDDMVADLEEFEGFEAEPATPTLKPIVKIIRRLWLKEFHADQNDLVVRQALINVAYALRRRTEAEKLAGPKAPPEEAPAPALRALTKERHDGLEAALQEDPNDDLTWALYADWLAAKGDPRGELIGLEMAQDPEARVIAEAHREILLGGFAEAYAQWGRWHGEVGMNQGATAVQLNWRYGFIVGATVQTWRPAHKHLADILRPLFAAAPMLNALTLQGQRIPRAAQAVLSAAAPAGLRWLEVGPEAGEPGFDAGDPATLDLAALVEGCPYLQEIEAPRIKVEAFPPPSPALRAVTLPGDSLTADAAAIVNPANYPNLERVALEEPAIDAALRLVDVAARHPRLTRLEFRGTQATPAIVHALLESDVPERLVHLSLTRGTLFVGDGLTALIDNAARFSKLTYLDVSENDLDAAVADPLEKAFGDALNFDPQDGEWFDGVEE